MTVAATPRRALTIHFQGLCAFLRNHPSLEKTTEVTSVLVEGDRADVKPPRLCLHGPFLTFDPENFVSSSASFHFTTLLPGTNRFSCVKEENGGRSAVGVWPLDGKDLRILGAAPGSLKIAPPFRPADLHELTHRGAASRSCLEPMPPSERLIGARISLTSGSLTDSAIVGDDPNERWTFDEEDANPPSGDEAVFSQELRYDFFSDSPNIELEARPIKGRGVPERLTLLRGSFITVSNLCAVERAEVLKERDFLAYYALLSSRPARPLIPHRLRDDSGSFGARIGMSACPPATTFVE